MTRLGVMSMAVVSLVGCGLPQDEGVVMGCFGLVNETIPGPDVSSTEVVTNTYFGGCDPSDPGMQIIERATTAAAADQGIMTARCDIDCNARLVAYAAAHPEVTLPLSCQTLFAIPCEGLRSNVPQVGGSDAILQGGGPADMRFLLSGDVTLTVDGQSSVVPAAGIVDGTLATSCQGAPESCPVTLSRLDVVGLEPFNLGGIHVDSAHIQNQGLAVGSKSGGQIVIGAEAIEAEVSAMVGGALRAFHVRNDEAVQAGGDPTLEQFLSSLDITMTQGNVTVRIDMTGTPVGQRPVAAFTPQTTSYECPSSPCTVQLTSAASDPDDDLQSLSWLVDGVPQLWEASGVPATIDLVLPVGPHTVSLVATDSRGAASAASLDIHVGSAPVVMFASPTANQVLCPAGSPNPSCLKDAVAGTPGWQGDLTVHVSGGGAPITSGNVTFSANGAPLGNPVALDSNGNATLPAATVPNGMQTIVAMTDDIPNRGVGTGSVAVNVIDDIVPTVPLDLRTMVVDRRGVTIRLTWTAPNDSGATVSGYEIRYAKVPITSANFDDTSVTTVVNTVGFTPAPPTQSDSIDVPGLYIENDYYFAVVATDLGGNRSAIASTPTAAMCSCDTACCAAHFTRSTLIGTSGLGNEGAGVALDGAGDANGDGLSDMLLGTFNAGRAYLFFGTTMFNPTTPSVVITSTNTSFGRGVAYVGDIDNDGREDFAVAATSLNRVYIYRGRATWPMTLTDGDADFDITTGAAYTSSSFGSVMARLGDFNGDGIDDVAIGAPNFGGSPTFRGRITIVLGSASFADLSLPDTGRAIVIDADSALATPFFGTRIVGLGRFYPGSTGTLVVSAPGINGLTSNNEGRIYAFRGQAGTAGVINIASADAVVIGSAPMMRTGAILANLGPIAGALPSVGAGNPNDATAPGGGGSAHVYAGDTTAGPFATRRIFYTSGSTLTGAAVMGGGISGRDITLSLVGTKALPVVPDLVVVSRNATNFGIVDGRKLPGAGTTTDTRVIADSIVPFPPGWTSAPLLIGGASLIPDVNGDGYADVALSNGASNMAGSVVVYW